MPRLAVIGHPVAHTRSPDMQTAALSDLGLAGEWTYGAIDILPENFESEIAEMAATAEYVGVNVTLPHKEAALAMADEATAAARAIGAANTLTFRDGRIAAANTDADGVLRSLPASLAGGEGDLPRRALVLGAGGAARAAIWALAHGGEGAPGEEGEATVVRAFDVDVWNRTAARAETVAGELGGRPVDEPDAAEYALIVNTTAVGLHGEDPFAHLPLAEGSFHPGQVVFDIVYGPQPSALLAAAGAAGAITVDGLEMLVQQGAISLRIWTGEEPSLEAMRTGASR